jgi:hypothetical protein
MDLTIKHKAGQENLIADALYRNPSVVSAVSGIGGQSFLPDMMADDEKSTKRVRYCRWCTSFRE